MRLGTLGHRAGTIPCGTDQVPCPQTFDPDPWLAPWTRDIYERPDLYKRQNQHAPHVAMRASRADMLKFLRVLRDTKRLHLDFAKHHVKLRRVAVNSVVKSEDLDRIIVDARVPNSLEER